jgi:hypothetical protein
VPRLSIPQLTTVHVQSSSTDVSAPRSSDTDASQSQAHHTSAMFSDDASGTRCCQTLGNISLNDAGGLLTTHGEDINCYLTPRTTVTSCLPTFLSRPLFSITTFLHTPACDSQVVHVDFQLKRIHMCLYYVYRYSEPDVVLLTCLNHS